MVFQNNYRSLIIFLLMMMGCNAHINPAYKPLDPGHFDKQGHRGCRGLLPENTIPAFIYALDLGVTTLEMDVVVTKDSQVILSHEPFFNHEITTGPDGNAVDPGKEKTLNIFGMTSAETQQYDVGLKPHPRFPRQQKMKAVKPLLRDVIDTVQQAMKTRRRPYPYFNIEIKSTPATDGTYHPEVQTFSELVMQVIKEKQVEDVVIIQSFDIRPLQYLHAQYPQVKTALLVEADDKKAFALQVRDLGFFPAIYSPAKELVTPLLVQQCHEAGIRIIPWTVNDLKEIQQLKQLGVDGIISDYPDLFNE